MLCFYREGRSNAHVKGDYQRIGDVMLRNMTSLKVTQLSGRSMGSFDLFAGLVFVAEAGRFVFVLPGVHWLPAEA